MPHVALCVDSFGDDCPCVHYSTLVGEYRCSLGYNVKKYQCVGESSQHIAWGSINCKLKSIVHGERLDWHVLEPTWTDVDEFREEDDHAGEE